MKNVVTGFLSWKQDSMRDRVWESGPKALSATPSTRDDAAHSSVRRRRHILPHAMHSVPAWDQSTRSGA